MPIKTKKDLEADNKKLRAQLKEVTKKAKELLLDNPKPVSEGLDESGFAIIKRNGAFKYVELAFNAETKEAAVIEVRDSSRIPHSIQMAEMEGKKSLAEMISKAGLSKR